MYDFLLDMIYWDNNLITKHLFVFACCHAVYFPSLWFPVALVPAFYSLCCWSGSGGIGSVYVQHFAICFRPAVVSFLVYALETVVECTTWLVVSVHFYYFMSLYKKNFTFSRRYWKSVRRLFYWKNDALSKYTHHTKHMVEILDYETWLSLYWHELCPKCSDLTFEHHL